MLAAQLELGSFARGLWYFFGIVTAVGIFSGIAGLGLGYSAGILWELFHRNRRRDRLLRKAAIDESISPADSPAVEETALMEGVTEITGQPRLQLVTTSLNPVPNLVGRRLASIRFMSDVMELDFGGTRISVASMPIVTCGLQKYRFPEPGSRDALCDLIGARVQRMRTGFADRIELALDNGCELVVPRSGIAVA